jgi:diguanylate cyclase (GGDEF)-like protein
MYTEQNTVSPVRSGGSILVVDDVPSNIHMLSNILRDEHDVFFATSGADALRLAGERQPDLVLLDIMMPDMDGYEVCAKLREMPETRDIPVIFVTALGEEKDEERGLAMGAIDYFVKPLSPPIVRMRVRNHLELKRQRDMLRDMSLVDGLTGLANKRRLDEALDSEWRRCQRAGASVSLFILSVDCLQQYNEALGHIKGDECLRKVARTIAGYLCRPGDMAARYSTKEFMALLPETELEGAMQLAEQARTAVEALSIPHPNSLAGDRVSISCGVVASVPSMDMMPFQLISVARGYLQQAKDQGRNRVCGGEFGSI